ncbi:carbon-nitrogen hydrolase family protein [Crenobacter sp. SG2303]|uniref:Carbon-nitrogen hydrolase family protein n=1 Tax=Crenobacter oryzisoli TaxID=3056844 RepID=A0ABT7XS05_9NEIS|nr:MULTISPECIES: carbon-nitrogen hydrolase family protein [unclassified Crenobacter]MDN0076578.1 carbon-nitrogen hydrolase family protein [Crenobacter sp. SG2303]MDN0084578.1 carbon-nitrogen hydrolase family protein [Crenobacter sp. SG2305]
MNQRFIAAAVQMVSGTDVTRNLESAARLVREAAEAGAQLVVLPEYFVLMGRHETDKVAVRETPGEGPMQEALARMASDNDVWLVGGTVPLECPEPERVFNSTLVFSPEGEQVGRYDKIHLFGFSGLGETYCESNTIRPGQTPQKISMPLADIGFGICYDLRFPELFRELSPFDLFVLPAAFTATTGEAHWEPLLRARAIESQAYVIASAQGGEHENGRKTHGHSMIIDPWGRILAELPKGEGVILAEIDPALLNSVRTRLPSLAHRVL